MSSDTHDIKSEVNKYLKVGASLLVLTVVTVWISYFNVTVAIAVFLALVVATFKASLVASIFMHLIAEKRIIYIILGFTMFFFAMMMFLIIAGQYNVPEGFHSLEHSAATAASEHSEPAAHEEAGGHH